MIDFFRLSTRGCEGEGRVRTRQSLRNLRWLLLLIVSVKTGLLWQHLLMLQYISMMYDLTDGREKVQSVNRKKETNGSKWRLGAICFRLWSVVVPLSSRGLGPTPTSIMEPQTLWWRSPAPPALCQGLGIKRPFPRRAAALISIQTKSSVLQE